MYRWELDEAAEPYFNALRAEIQARLTAFMDAVVLVDPVEYQRHCGERSEPPALLRTVHFGDHHEGLVTFLIYPPGDLVLVVRLQWLGD